MSRVIRYIHCMKFAIDTLTLDKDNVILYIDHEIQPGKIRKMVSKGRRVLELPSGTANKYMLQVGQVIQWSRKH